MIVVACAAVHDAGIFGSGKEYDLLDLVTTDVREDAAVNIFLKKPVRTTALRAHAVGAPAHYLHDLADLALFQQLLCIHRTFHMQTLAEIAEKLLPGLAHRLTHLLQMLERDQRRLVHKKILAVAHSLHAQRPAIQRDGCRSDHLHIGGVHLILARRSLRRGERLLELRHLCRVGVVHQRDLGTRLGQTVAHAVDVTMVQPDDSYGEVTRGAYRL